MKRELMVDWKVERPTPNTEIRTGSQSVRFWRRTVFEICRLFVIEWSRGGSPGQVEKRGEILDEVSYILPIARFGQNVSLPRRRPL